MSLSREMATTLSIGAAIASVSFALVLHSRTGRTSASISATDGLVLAYKSETGFVPVVYRKDSEYEWYTLLDVVTEDGDFVRSVNLQTILPNRGHGLLVTYVSQRNNCRTWQATTVGEGETVAQMKGATPDNHYWELTPGSIETNTAFAACKYAGKAT